MEVSFGFVSRLVSKTQDYLVSIPRLESARVLSYQGGEPTLFEASLLGMARGCDSLASLCIARLRKSTSESVGGDLSGLFLDSLCASVLLLGLLGPRQARHGAWGLAFSL